MADLAAQDSAESDDIAAFLESLTTEQWDAPTLCEQWRVRDVVGHLVSTYELGPVRIVGAIVRNRFSPDRAIAGIAIERGSQATPDELVAAWRARRPGGLGKLIPAAGLFYDHFVHHQDMRRPLGLHRDIPRERLLALLDLAPGWGGGIRSRQRARGLRLVAPDVDWSHGDGPEVRGPSEALLMALAGRPTALAELEGDGLAILTPRVSSGA